MTTWSRSRKRRQPRDNHDRPRTIQNNHGIHRIHRRPKTPHNGADARPPISRTSRKRRNNLTNPKMTSMARNEPMNSRLYEGVCHVPAEQSSNPQNKSPPLLHYNPRNDNALPTNHNGLDYRITKPPRKRHHPYYC